MANIVVGDVASLSECHVRVYLAFFDNAEHLAWLVTLQAATTVVGNCTVCLAAWWIWRQANLSKT
jgi:hypothetical protein